MSHNFDGLGFAKLFFKLSEKAENKVKIGTTHYKSVRFLTCNEV